jgi:ribosome modulation factor
MTACHACGKPNQAISLCDRWGCKPLEVTPEFIEGARACSDGKSRDTCPYSERSQAREEWMKGYRMADGLFGY